MTGYKTSKIAIDATTDSLADKKMQAYILPVKQNLDKEMDQIMDSFMASMRRD